MKKVFIISLLLSLFIAPESLFAVELIEGGSNPASELLLASASNCPEGGGTVDADASQSEPSFTISGPDAVSSNGTAQYTTDLTGDITWSVYGNFGTGGGISQSGELTIGSNTCGAVKVTAYVNGNTATQDVRVTDSGTWTYVKNCFDAANPSVGCGYWYSWVGYTYNGRYRCENTYFSRYDLDCDMPDYPGCLTEPLCSECPTVYQGCYGSPEFQHWYTGRQLREWVCSTCTNNTDSDNDNYTACGSPADCNDSDPAIYPGAQEICDGKDNNCNGEVDEGCCEVGCEDKDEDGYYGFDAITCPEGDDCDDSNPFINPGATEICDGLNNNCNGQTDEDLMPPACNQTGVCSGTTQTCEGASGWSGCDYDGNSLDYESTEQSCDDLDNDCDGETDEGCCGVTIPNVPLQVRQCDSRWKKELYDNTNSIICDKGCALASLVMLMNSEGCYDVDVPKVNSCSNCFTSSGGIDWSKILAEYCPSIQYNYINNKTFSYGRPKPLQSVINIAELKQDIENGYKYILNVQGTDGSCSHFVFLAGVSEDCSELKVLDPNDKVTTIDGICGYRKFK